MIKYYCDRCGKEVRELITVKIPVNKLKDGSFGSKRLDVCEECKNEAENIFATLADIKIFMCSKYLKKEGAEL